MKTKIGPTLFAVLLLFLQLSSSCAVNRVRYSEDIETDGILTRIVLLDAREMNELVITMQNPGHRIKERVFLINWMPDHVEIDDYNGDSRLDVKITSASGETHYFFSTELGFVDI